MTSPVPHRRFEFDTHFEDGGHIREPVRPRKTYSPEEVEVFRADAIAEGEASALVQAEQRIAEAVEQIARDTHSALGLLAQVVQSHRAGAAELALAAAGKIADAALTAFPVAALHAAVESLIREIEHEPRLLIHAQADMIERLQPEVLRAAEHAGFPGQIILRPKSGLAAAAFVLEWADGRACFDPEATGQAIADTVATALAAEGLHAEPLLPFEDTSK